MSDIVISVVGVSKCYLISHKSAPDGIRHILEQTIRAPWRSIPAILNRRSKSREEFWALRDVSFEISRGEVLGVIGSNGAGKSTLLKLLSRISEPTNGKIHLRGRVASLLEVGTGFHPELTGRENIFLNGAIMGMRREEIRKKFDEIVDFAEIEQFLDTPVKRYSSGMYVRLAFSVAAHLDPDILIVDEVLAVGDSGFQKKCLGKMAEASRRSRTTLFVSHNFAALENFCTRCVVLERGRVAFSGSCRDAIAFYLHGSGQCDETASADIIELDRVVDQRRNRQVRLKSLELSDAAGKPLRGSMSAGSGIKARITAELDQPVSSVCVELSFFTLSGQRVCTAHSAYESDWNYGKRAGEQVFVCEIASLPLVPNEYQIQVSLEVALQTVDCVSNAARLTVVQSDFYGTGIIPTNGVFMLGNRWKTASSF